MAQNKEELSSKQEAETFHSFMERYCGTRVPIVDVLEAIKEKFPQNYNGMRTLLKTECVEFIDGDYLDFTGSNGVFIW